MYTISLDEQGNFEKPHGNEPLFIAGIMFDDKGNDDEVRSERKRIVNYYKQVIEEAKKVYTGDIPGRADETRDWSDNYVYPGALHSDGDSERDNKVVRYVKQIVSETLGEFIKQATYRGKQVSDNRSVKRKGQYSVFVILKSKDGKKALLKPSADRLLNDDYAANRYYHMAETVVTRIIFSNPLLSYKDGVDFSIDIATRSSAPVRSLDMDEKNELTELAYRKNIENTEEGQFSLMNPDIYRTLIAQEILDSCHSNIHFSGFKVSSINYSGNGYRMEFLYMSDSICSMLGWELKISRSDEQRLEIVNAQAKKLTGKNQNLIFGYDEIDNYFSLAWSAYERRDYFDALSVIYDAGKKKGVFADYYNKIWFRKIEALIREEITPDIYTYLIDRASSMIMTNNLDQEKLIYIIEQCENMVPNVRDQYKSKDSLSRVLYKL
ncbi:MAG: hypothetical protein J5824_03290, partial [Lachnospiraceae bacterium]|nr:hypothetical protein [Lachnospiraceae bacterium]